MGNSLAIKSSAVVTQRHLTNPHVCRILEVALETSPPTEDDRIWITSGEDGQHSEQSFHYVKNGSRALDLRTRNITANDEVQRASRAGMWCVRMRKRLGSEYDVVLETDHVHIEHDPKVGG